MKGKEVAKIHKYINIYLHMHPYIPTSVHTLTQAHVPIRTPKAGKVLTLLKALLCVLICLLTPIFCWKEAKTQDYLVYT